MIYDKLLSDLYALLNEQFNLLEYLFTIEKYTHSKHNFDHHIHAYFTVNPKIYINKLSQFLRTYLQFKFIDTQPVRSSKSVIKYITKDAYNPFVPLTNIKLEKFHFNARARYWAKSEPTFSYANSFVLEHRNNYNFLRHLHDEIQFMYSFHHTRLRRRNSIHV